MDRVRRSARTPHRLAALACALLLAVPAIAAPPVSVAGDDGDGIVGSVFALLQHLLGGGDEVRPPDRDETRTMTGPAGPAIDPDGNDHSGGRDAQPPKNPQ